MIDAAISPLVLDRMEIEESGAEPSRLAAAIHAQLPKLNGSVPVHAIAAALDITEIREAFITSFEGALVMTPDRGKGSIVVNARSAFQRRRFTIAHELGHFLNIWHTPINPDGGFTCRTQDLSQFWSTGSLERDRHRVQEAEANRFAIELLAPRSMLRRFLKGIPDLAQIVRIATTLDLSREASARRYIELHEEPLALVFSKAGVVRYINRNDAFPYIKLSWGDILPSLPTLLDGTSITDHEQADPRDWGLRPNGSDLVVQTLFQENGFTMTLLALDRSETQTDDISF